MTNEEVCNKIQDASGKHEKHDNLLTIYSKESYHSSMNVYVKSKLFDTKQILYQSVSLLLGVYSIFSSRRSLHISRLVRQGRNVEFRNLMCCFIKDIIISN